MELRRNSWYGIALGAVLLALVAACGASEPTADSVREATEKYKDVQVALADGYLPTDECVASPAGAMGLHYVNPPLIADGEIDPAKPDVLQYIPDGDGVRLIAVEYMMPVGAPGADVPASPPEAPTLLGQRFDGPMEGHNPQMPPHYDLHAWVWEENPSGMFEDFNPSVSCPDELEVAKKATEKYHDVNVALADGYVATDNCVASPAGAMGFHYVNPDLARDPELDLSKPEILLYIPTADGVKLAGFEYSFGIGAPGTGIPDPAPAAPVILDQTFNGPMESHGPDGPPHYDLHVWAWEENPTGTFADFNPSLSCPE